MRVVGILYLALTHTVVVIRRARETKKQKSYSPVLYTVNHAGEDDRESQKSCCFLLRSVHAAITPLSPVDFIAFVRRRRVLLSLSSPL